MRDNNVNIALKERQLRNRKTNRVWADGKLSGTTIISTCVGCTLLFVNVVFNVGWVAEVAVMSCNRHTIEIVLYLILEKVECSMKQSIQGMLTYWFAIWNERILSKFKIQADSILLRYIKNCIAVKCSNFAFANYSLGKYRKCHLTENIMMSFIMDPLLFLLL